MIESKPEVRLASRPQNAWTDLGLTLPVFLVYHLGVVALPVQNAADLLTRTLTELAERSLMTYWLLTLSIGAAFVTVLLVLGRGQSLRWQRFVAIAGESILYAVVLRVVASAVVGRLHLDVGLGSLRDTFPGLVMALGAGFYEELVFRVGLFALGGRLVWLAFVASPLPWKRFFFWVGWAAFTSALFSAWHHVGTLGEPFSLGVFVFRWSCGLLFTLIFAFRGFAPVVWTHMMYDIWVLVL